MYYQKAAQNYPYQIQSERNLEFSGDFMVERATLKSD